MKQYRPKTPQEIASLTQAGAYLTELLLLIRDAARPGVRCLDLEILAQSFIDKNNVRWAFKWFQGFPANLCLSVNACLVHWIPDATVLTTWDLLKIDAWIIYQWMIADAAISVVVGGRQTNPQADRLIVATKDSLDSALPYVLPGWSLYAFGEMVSTVIHNNWFQVIKNLTWHGVGHNVHEWPHIYNRPNPSTRKQTFMLDMVVALEPITAVTSSVYVEDETNWWNLYTQHWDLGAQREYTVHISDNWPRILAGVTEYA
jgi:methionyl aminopeptidase